ncbi:MAG: hypothetical protein QOK35_2282 [Pseudonocardiales bacterium]|nr:hypothetical protein [Pseudonocardiales bacterium]
MTTSTSPRVPATIPALPRSQATRRVNRIVLALLGLVLTAVGVLTVLAGLGVLGSAIADGPVLVDGASRFAADTPWFWPAVGVGGVVLAALALRWLLIQLRSNHIGDIDVESDRSRGETVLSPGAVTAALDAEIESYLGVDSAHSVLRDHHGRTLLLVKVGLNGRVGVAEIRDAVETRAVAHARQALDEPDLPARIELTVSPRRVRRPR